MSVATLGVVYCNTGMALRLAKWWQQALLSTKDATIDTESARNEWLQINFETIRRCTWRTYSVISIFCLPARVATQSCLCKTITKNKTYVPRFATEFAAIIKFCISAFVYLLHWLQQYLMRWWNTWGQSYIKLMSAAMRKQWYLWITLSMEVFWRRHVRLTSFCKPF